MAVSSDSSLAISGLQPVIDHAAMTEGWLVIVCPSVKSAHKTRMLVAAMLPEGSASGGRTAVMAGGGRLSVASVTEEVFADDFDAVFFGWDAPSEEEVGGMMRWRAKARTVLDLAKLAERVA